MRLIKTYVERKNKVTDKLKNKKEIVIKKLYSYFSLVCEMGAGGKKQSK